jgi:hypothetical protein
MKTAGCWLLDTGCWIHRHCASGIQQPASGIRARQKALIPAYSSLFQDNLFLITYPVIPCSIPRPNHQSSIAAVRWSCGRLASSFRSLLRKRGTVAARRPCFPSAAHPHFRSHPDFHRLLPFYPFQHRFAPSVIGKASGLKIKRQTGLIPES